MNALVWDESGTRRYESGVDKGVLYLPSVPGVAWNGLISVEEGFTGGETDAFYFDGVKYHDHVSNENFKGVLRAYTYPDEFAVCEGNSELATGMFFTRQTRQPFGLSYRTKVGNDLEGIEYGYQIHLIYNVTATPSASKTYQTLGDSPTVTDLQWDLNAVPVWPGEDAIDQTTDPNDWVWPAGYAAPGWPVGPDGNTPVPGWKATPYFIVDSRDTDPLILKDLEDRLYGSDLNFPHMPSQFDLVNLLNGNEVPMPDWAMIGGGSGVAHPTTVNYDSNNDAYDNFGMDPTPLGDGSDSTSIALVRRNDSIPQLQLFFDAVPEATAIDLDNIMIRAASHVDNPDGRFLYVYIIADLAGIYYTALRPDNGDNPVPSEITTYLLGPDTPQDPAPYLAALQGGTLQVWVTESSTTGSLSPGVNTIEIYEFGIPYS